MQDIFKDIWLAQFLLQLMLYCEHKNLRGTFYLKTTVYIKKKKR